MKRIAAPLSILLGLSVAGPVFAQSAEPAPGFAPPPQKIERPYTNDKCLKNCHERPGLAAGGGRGVLRSLHVDALSYVASTHGQKGLECVDCHVDADPNFHPRKGYSRVDCRACHSLTPPSGVFPPDALQRLEAKGIKPPPLESRKAENWMKTRHAKAWAGDEPKAPFCSGCHTAHSIRRSSDPASTVHRARLSRTCGRCHADQTKSLGVGGALAGFRIAGHGKGDLSNRYAVTECLACHQGEAAHGEETVTQQACPNCHRPADRRRPGETVLSSLHVKPCSPDQPLARLLGWGYAAAVWGGAAGFGVIALILGFSTLYRSKDS